MCIYFAIKSSYMINNFSNVKLICLILTSVFLLQSCKIYRKKTATTEEAVEFNRGVKIITQDDKTYKFKRFIKEDGELFGLTKKNSKIAKELSHLIREGEPKKGYIKISLSADFIKEIHLLNKFATTTSYAIIVNAAVISFWAIVFTAYAY